MRTNMDCLEEREHINVINNNIDCIQLSYSQSRPTENNGPILEYIINTANSICHQEVSANLLKTKKRLQCQSGSWPSQISLRMLHRARAIISPASIPTGTKQVMQLMLRCCGSGTLGALWDWSHECPCNDWTIKLAMHKWLNPNQRFKFIFFI